MVKLLTRSILKLLMYSLRVERLLQLDPVLLIKLLKLLTVQISWLYLVVLIRILICNFPSWAPTLLMISIQEVRLPLQEEQHHILTLPSMIRVNLWQLHMIVGEDGQTEKQTVITLCTLLLLNGPKIQKIRWKGWYKKGSQVLNFLWLTIMF